MVSKRISHRLDPEEVGRQRLSTIEALNSLLIRIRSVLLSVITEPPNLIILSTVSCTNIFMLLA